MACNGIAVMNLKFGENSELLVSETSLKAVATLLNNLGLTASMRAKDAIEVNGYTFRLSQAGELIFNNYVPQKLRYQVKDCCETIAGALTQQKVANEVASKTRVLSRTTQSNGSIVMNVVLRG